MYKKNNNTVRQQVWSELHKLFVVQACREVTPLFHQSKGRNTIRCPARKRKTAWRRKTTHPIQPSRSSARRTNRPQRSYRAGGGSSPLETRSCLNCRAKRPNRLCSLLAIHPERTYYREYEYLHLHQPRPRGRSLGNFTARPPAR